jgi:hypothetical protein
MIMDALLLLDGSVNSAGAFVGTTVNSGTTFTVGNQVSANIYDMSQLPSSASGLGRDLGPGDDLSLVVMVGTAFTGSSSTLQVNLQYAPDNGSGSPGSWVTMQSSVLYTLAQLSAGSELMRMQLPPYSPAPAGGSALPKFIQISYAVGTANMTAGSIFAAITIDRQALGPLLGYKSGYVNTYI